MYLIISDFYFYIFYEDAERHPHRLLRQEEINMSGKFMNVKRIIIPTLTMIIITSQLMGCASVSQDEALNLLRQGDQIEIEIATPIDTVEAEKDTLAWEQLASLSTYSAFRSAFDTALGVVPTSDSSKNGIVYINLAGDQDGNNTLYNAMMNRKFYSNYWENEVVQSEVQKALASQFTDVDEDTITARYAALGVYFDLLPTKEQPEFHGDDSLTRAEAMTLIMRAETPVTESESPETFVDFVNAVGSESPYTNYAGYLMNDSYLTIDTGSLTSKTFTSTISRGEYIYMLMNHYFKEDLSTVDTKSASFSDAKDAGDLSTTKAFEKYDGSKDCWQTAELANAIANPDDGCPTRMYKALVLANTLDIVNKETRWDEGLSRSEAIQLLADTYAKLAEAKGYPIDTTLGKTNIVETIEDTVVDNTITDTENSTTSEAQSKSEINENDSQTSEGETIEEEVVATPTPAPEVNNSSSSYVMSDELKQDLKTLGATDAEIAAIKSEKDMTDLVDKLITGGTTGNSGSTAGGSSSSADTGSSGSIGDGNDNDLPTATVDMTNAPAGHM